MASCFLGAFPPVDLTRERDKEKIKCLEFIIVNQHSIYVYIQRASDEIWAWGDGIWKILNFVWFGCTYVFRIPSEDAESQLLFSILSATGGNKSSVANQPNLPHPFGLYSLHLFTTNLLNYFFKWMHYLFFFFLLLIYMPAPKKYNFAIGTGS